MLGLLTSIVAIYHYDPDIFADMALPAVSDLNSTAELISPIEPLDKDLLIGNILSELGELSLVYTDPDVLRKMIEIWSKINKRQWTQLWETLLYKYNPIWNKDGKYTETRDLDTTGHETGTRATTVNNSRATSSTVNHNVTGYDQDIYKPNTQDTGSGSVTDSGTGSDNTSANKTGTEDETITRVEQGNIGVTTTQQMINEQREVVEFNLYHYITESFKTRFCLMTY